MDAYSLSENENNSFGNTEIEFWIYDSSATDAGISTLAQPEHTSVFMVN